MATQTYKKNGKGFLFENDKGDNPKRPDFSGKLDLEIDEDDLSVDGDGKVRISLKLSAWNSESQSTGAPYIGIQVGDIAEGQ